MIAVRIFVPTHSFIQRIRKEASASQCQVRKDKGIASHEVRSGINFLVQSVASDINLLGAIDMQHYINRNGMNVQDIRASARLNSCRSARR